MMIKKMFLVALAAGVFASSCSNDDDNNAATTANLTLDFQQGDQKLEELGAGYVYEGWIIVDGAAVSTGTFTSVTFPQSFTVDADQLAAAAKFVLTIEPAGETGVEAETPANTKILAGDFSGSTASINTGVVGDFSTASGKYILATPTDNDMTNEASGVWFLDNENAPPPVAGLVDLPVLPEGWKYEGWAVVDGTPLSTGTFTNVSATDDAAPFSGPVALPMPNGADGFFPGEDFLENAPEGLTFPLDLKGKTIVISVEPSPDNSSAPFTLKPLAHTVPSDATNGTPISMGTGPVVSLTATVTRK